MLQRVFRDVGDPHDRLLLSVWWTGLAALLIRGNTVFEQWATLFVSLWSGFLLVLFLVLTRERIALPRRVLLAGGVVLLAAAASAATTVNADASERELARLFSAAALFTATAAIVQEPRRWRWCVRGMATLAVAIIVGSVGLYLREGLPRPDHILRGPFFWHNQMGSFLLVSFPILVGMARTGRGRTATLWFALAGVAVASLALTFSRASWLVALAVIPLTFAALGVRRRTIGVLTGSVVLAGVIVAAALPAFRSALALRARSLVAETGAEQRTTSGNVRLDTIAVARRTLKERFLLGTGPGTFADAALHFQRAPWRYAAHAHNEALEMAAEVGIVGGAFFALFFLCAGSVAAHAARAARREQERSSDVLLGAALGVALLASLARFLMDTDWSFVGLQAAFIVLLALVSTRPRAEESRAPDVAVAAVPRRIAALLAVSPLLLAVWIGLDVVHEGQFRAALADGNLERADAVAVQWTRTHPWSAKAHRTAAQIAFLRQDYRRSEQILQRAIALAPWRGEALIALGEIREFLLDRPGAIAAYEEALRTTPYLSPHPVTRIATLRRRASDPAGAEAALRDAVLHRFPLNEDFAAQFYLLRHTTAGQQLRTLYGALVSRWEETGKATEAAALRRRWASFPLLPPL